MKGWIKLTAAGGKGFLKISSIDQVLRNLVYNRPELALFNNQHLTIYPTVIPDRQNPNSFTYCLETPEQVMELIKEEEVTQ